MPQTSEGDQRGATLKLPFGVLILSCLLRNKTLKDHLTLFFLMLKFYICLFLESYNYLFSLSVSLSIHLSIEQSINVDVFLYE